MRRGRALLGEEERLDGIEGLRGREKIVGDVVRPDGEGGMSVVDGFEASYSRKGAFSCCNFFISARAVVKSAYSCWDYLLLWFMVRISK